MISREVWFWTGVILLVVFILVSAYVFFIPSIRAFKTAETTAQRIDTALIAYCQGITNPPSALRVTSIATAPCQSLLSRV